MDLTQRAYCDRILRVNLSTGSIETTPLPAEVMPLILGGKGLGAWLLYTEQSAGVDPLSPENHMIFHTGPLTGTTAPTAGRFGLTTKSPATGTYFDAYCGGYWGNMLKYAGYDALVINRCRPKSGHAGHRWGSGGNPSSRKPMGHDHLRGHRTNQS